MGLLLACALAGCGSGKAPSTGQPVAVRGNLVLAPGQNLPAGMPVELELVAQSPATEGAGPLASTTIEWVEGAETPFSLDYPPANAAADTRYVLRARAALQGRVFLAGEALAPVPLREPDLAVDVLLRRPADAPPLYLDVSVLRLEHKREGDWSRDLREFMPAISVCLRSVSGQGIAVTKAWAAGGGRIGVRMRTTDGSGFDCTALPDGSKFDNLAGLPSFAAALPGENEPSFVPAPGSPTMSECRRYERVLGGLGETLGWLVYQTCPIGQEPGAPATPGAPSAPATAPPTT